MQKINSKSEICSRLKSSQSFLPELRLFNVIEEDYLVGMALGTM